MRRSSVAVGRHVHGRGRSCREEVLRFIDDELCMCHFLGCRVSLERVAFAPVGSP